MTTMTYNVQTFFSIFIMVSILHLFLNNSSYFIYRNRDNDLLSIKTSHYFVILLWSLCIIFCSNIMFSHQNHHPITSLCIIICFTNMIYRLLLDHVVPTFIRIAIIIIQSIFIHRLQVVLLYYHYNIIEPLVRFVNLRFFMQRVSTTTKKKAILHWFCSFLMVCNTTSITYIKSFGTTSKSSPDGSNNFSQKIERIILLEQGISFLFQICAIICIWFYTLLPSFTNTIVNDDDKKEVTTGKNHNNMSLLTIRRKQRNITLLSISFPIVFFAKIHYIIVSNNEDTIKDSKQNQFDDELVLDFLYFHTFVCVPIFYAFISLFLEMNEIISNKLYDKKIDHDDVDIVEDNNKVVKCYEQIDQGKSINATCYIIITVLCSYCLLRPYYQGYLISFILCQISFK